MYILGPVGFEASVRIPFMGFFILTLYPNLKIIFTFHETRDNLRLYTVFIITMKNDTVKTMRSQ